MPNVTTVPAHVNPPHLPLPPAGLHYRSRQLKNGVYFTTGCFPADAPNARDEHLAWVPALVLDADFASALIHLGVHTQAPALAAVAEALGMSAAEVAQLSPKKIVEAVLHRDLLGVCDLNGIPNTWGKFREEHLNLCRSAFFGLGIEASAVVDSGYGFHFYFLLDQPAATREAIQQARLDNYRLLHACNSECGFEVFDAQVWDCGTRILRLPGTVNPKGSSVRPVRIIDSTGRPLPEDWHAPGDAIPGGLFGEKRASTDDEAPRDYTPASDAGEPSAGGPQRQQEGGSPAMPPAADDALIKRVCRDERAELYYHNKGRNKPGSDTSPSGYDAALAYQLLRLDFTDEEVIAVLRRKRAGDDKPARHFTATLEYAKQQRAAQLARNKASAPTPPRPVAVPVAAQIPADPVVPEVTPPPAPVAVAVPVVAPAPTPEQPPMPPSCPAVAHENPVPPAPPRPVSGLAPDVPAPAAVKKLCVNSKGTPVADFCNVEILVKHDPRFKGALAYNTRTQLLSWTEQAEELLRAIGAKSTEPGAVDEPTLTLLASWIGQVYGIFHIDTKLYPGFVALAPHHDPLRDELIAAGKAWDGVPRLDNWIARTFSLAPSVLLSAYSRRWLVAAVWRALDPRGLNFKHILCLTGGQSVGKSAIFKILAGEENVCDETLDFDRESIMQVREKWVVEIAELAGMSKREVEAFKNFISKQSDTIRLPYDRRPTTVTRRFVFAATTNNPEFLEDKTGSVRWWTVPVTDRADFKWLEENRLQILGEAVRVYQENKHRNGYCDMQEEERNNLEAASGVTWTADATVADPLGDALRSVASDMRSNGRTTCSALELLERVHAWAALRNTTPKALANAARLAGWQPHRSADARGWLVPAR